MKKLLYILFTIAICSSCAEQYNIAGNSNVSCLDGRMLYLRISSNNDNVRHSTQQIVSVCLDSCKVIHGRFNFEGDVDSAMMAMIYTGNQCVMPLVLENGNLNIQVDNATQRVSGGPLNDKLYNFFKKRSRLDNELWEVQQLTMRMMREGFSPIEIQKKVGKKTEKLNKKTEDLETRFVMENYNNVLGPGFFRLLCSQFPIPVMTDQIQQIVSSAPSHFLNDPYVKNYIRQANLQAKMQQQAIEAKHAMQQMEQRP